MQLRIRPAGAPILLLTLFAVTCNGSEGAGDVKTQEPSSWNHRVLAYGDSRTGFYVIEDQENAGQKVHEWLVGKMLARVGGDKAHVVFTGDAVYAGGSRRHWDNYIRVVENFKKPTLSYFPLIGNHELYSAMAGIFAPLSDQITHLPDETLQDYGLTQAEAKGWRKLMVGRDSTFGILEANEREEQEKALDQQMETAKSAFPKLDKWLFTNPADKRAQRGRHLMEDVYVTRARFDHLKPTFQTSTYYSTELKSEKQKVLLVMLDTNVLDLPAQKNWFEKLVDGNTDEVIIVFGHHPPPTIAGWDWLMPYLLGQKGPRAVLWVFGHVHAFEQYVKKSTSVDRALFISGGGGASLEDAKKTSVLELPGWEYEPKTAADGKIYHFLDIRISTEAVYVTVVASTSTKVNPMAIGTIKVSLKGQR